LFILQFHSSRKEIKSSKKEKNEEKEKRKEDPPSLSVS